MRGEQSADLVLVPTAQCPACESTKGQTVWFRLNSFVVKKCSCGHRFIDPSLDAHSQMLIYQSSEALRKINPALDFYYEYDVLSEKTITYRDYVRTLQAIETMTPGRTLLEVGCGSGSFLKVARNRGWTVTGLDSSAENIGRVEQAGLEGVESGFLEYESERQYDCIAFWDLIEHTQTPRAFLSKSMRLLARDGILLIAAPHYPNLLSITAEILYRLSLGKVAVPLEQLYLLEHTSYFSAKTLRLLLECCGFEVAKFWKTETDLDRYRFSPPLKIALRVAFVVARFLGLQNRIHVLARKAPGL